MSDELEARLRRADPVGPHVSVEPVDGPRAATLRRTIMDFDNQTTTGTSGSGARGSASVPIWRRPLVVSALGAAAAAAVVITVVAVSAGDDPTTEPTTVSYALGAADPMAMCLPVSDIQPSEGTAALAGTVVSAEGGTVVLEVDRWYAGGDADRVELRGTEQSVALDGVDFVVGQDYLVSAAAGAVLPCGQSGPASPELEALFDQWYG